MIYNNFDNIHLAPRHATYNYWIPSSIAVELLNKTLHYIFIIYFAAINFKIIDAYLEGNFILTCALLYIKLYGIIYCETVKKH